jgi:tetratricopeptide (TPR) repeat protein
MQNAALELEESPDALAKRGLALAKKGEVDSAISLLKEAVRRRPDHVQAHHNLGIALADKKKFEEAIASLKSAIERDPGYADAHFNLGAVFNQLNRDEDALASFQRAHDLRPGHLDTLNNLALALTRRHRSDEAIVLLQHALRLCPDFTAARNNLGLAFIDVGEYAQAERCFQESLKTEPKAIDSLNNLGTTYKEAGNLKRALAHYELAVRLKPDHISARWNRSLCLLQMGNYARGWAEYECRRKKPGHQMLSFPKPYWDGAPLKGRTLLLHAEQGRGDAIQFIRYAGLVPRDGGNLIFYSPRDLAVLFADCPGIDLIIADRQPLPDFDVHASLLSLPHLLGLHRPVAKTPYLMPSEERRAPWRNRLSAIPGTKIGIAWQGNPKHANDHHRSMPLRLLAPLAELPGIRLVSLQRGYGIQQMEDFRMAHPLESFEHIEDDAVAFAESAALISELPLVVTVDTAVAHLAGSLGVRTLVATSRHNDWRWQVDRSDNDWYPRMRLIRQQQLDDWKPVVAEILRLAEGHLASLRA